MEKKANFKIFMSVLVLFSMLFMAFGTSNYPYFKGYKLGFENQVPEDVVIKVFEIKSNYQGKYLDNKINDVVFYKLNQINKDKILNGNIAVMDEIFNSNQIDLSNLEDNQLLVKFPNIPEGKTIEYIVYFYTKGDFYPVTYSRFIVSRGEGYQYAYNDIQTPKNINFKKLSKQDPNDKYVAEIGQLNLINTDDPNYPIQVNVPLEVKNTICSAFRFTLDENLIPDPLFTPGYSDFSSKVLLNFDVYEYENGQRQNKIYTNNGVELNIRADDCFKESFFSWRVPAKYLGKHLDFNLNTKVVDEQVIKEDRGEDFASEVSYIYPQDLTNQCWAKVYNFTLSNKPNKFASVSNFQIGQAESLYAVFDAGSFKDNSATPIDFKYKISFDDQEVYPLTNVNFGQNQIGADFEEVIVDLTDHITNIPIGNYDVKLFVQTNGVGCQEQKSVIKTQNLQIHNLADSSVNFIIKDGGTLSFVQDANVELTLIKPDDNFANPIVYNQKKSTNLEGEVLFDNLFAGDYVVSVEKDGFNKIEKNVHISGEEEITYSLFKTNFKPQINFPSSGFKKYYKETLEFNLRNFVFDHDTLFENLDVKYNVIEGDANIDYVQGLFKINVNSPQIIKLEVLVNDSFSSNLDVLTINFFNNAPPVINEFRAVKPSGPVIHETNFIVNVTDEDGARDINVPIWDKVLNFMSATDSLQKEINYFLTEDFLYKTKNCNVEQKSCNWDLRVSLDSISGSNSPNWNRVVLSDIKKIDSKNYWFVIDDSNFYKTQIDSCLNPDLNCVWEKNVIGSLSLANQVDIKDSLKTPNQILTVIDSQKNFIYYSQISSCDQNGCEWLRDDLTKYQSNLGNLDLSVIKGNSLFSLNSKNYLRLFDGIDFLTIDVNQIENNGNFEKLNLENTFKSDNLNNQLYCTLDPKNGDDLIYAPCDEFSNRIISFENIQTYKPTLSVTDGYSDVIKKVATVNVYKYIDGQPIIRNFNGLVDLNEQNRTADLRLSWFAEHSTSDPIYCSLRYKNKLDVIVEKNVSCENSNYLFEDLSKSQTFTLIATELNGDDIATKQYTLNLNFPNRAPQINLSVTNKTGFGELNSTILFSVFDPDFDDLSCSINYGNGTIIPQIDCDLINGTKLYYNSSIFPVNYILGVTVNDGFGNAYKSVNLSILDPNLEFAYFTQDLSLTSSNGNLLPTDLVFDWEVVHPRNLSMNCSLLINDLRINLSSCNGPYSISNFNISSDVDFVLEVVDENLVVVNSSTINRYFANLGEVNLSLENVGLRLPREVKPGEFEFKFRTINETLAKREIEVEPKIVCHGIENYLDNADKKLDSKAISKNNLGDLYEFSFKTNTNDFKFEVPENEVCMFKLKISDDYDTQIVISDNVEFKMPEHKEKMTSFRGNTVDLINLFSEMIKEPIHKGYNSLNVELINNEKKSKKIDIGLISPKLNFNFETTLTLGPGEEREVSVPLFVGEDKKKGKYPIRYVINNDGLKQVRYGYIIVS